MLFYGLKPSIFAYRIQRFCDKETYIVLNTDFFSRAGTLDAIQKLQRIPARDSYSDTPQGCENVRM